MAEEQPLVENEIGTHKANLNLWISSVSTFNIPSSRKNVVERFVRDCRTMLTDVDAEETPSAADLVDFSDRVASLEIQFHHIKEDLQ